MSIEISNFIQTNSDDILPNNYEKEDQRNCADKDLSSKESHETFLGNKIDELDNEWYIFVGDNKVSESPVGKNPQTS